MRSGIQILALSLWCAVAATAQSNSSIGAPLMGLTLDQSSQVRPIVGVPGAASLGIAASVDPSIQVLTIGPHQDYLIGSKGDAGDLVLVQRPLGDANVTVLAAGFGAATVRVSPKGSAVLALGGSGAAQIWTGMPDNPATSWSADLSAAAAPSALAVSDDGQAILAAAAANNSISIFVATPGSGARVLTSVGQFGGFAFVAGAEDAVIGDAAANQVQMVRDVGGAATASQLGDASAGVASPVDLASSEDGRTVFVANSNPGGVLILDVSGGPPQRVGCDCSPSVLSRISGGEMFRLTDSAAGMFWIFSATGPTARITAVPPDPALASGTSGVQQ